MKIKPILIHPQHTTQNLIRDNLKKALLISVFVNKQIPKPKPLRAGAFDGVPELPQAVRYGIWVKAMHTEFKSLRTLVRQGAETLIDRYGATNEVEFFAVLTELFFENPQALKAKRPELYSLLGLYLNLDPLTLQPAKPPDATAGEITCEKCGAEP